MNLLWLTLQMLQVASVQNCAAFQAALILDGSTCMKVQISVVPAACQAALYFSPTPASEDFSEDLARDLHLQRFPGCACKCPTPLLRFGSTTDWPPVFVCHSQRGYGVNWLVDITGEFMPIRQFKAKASRQGSPLAGWKTGRPPGTMRPETVVRRSSP